MMGEVDKIACPPFPHCYSMPFVSLPMSTEPALRRALRYRIEDTLTGWLSAPTVRQRYPLRTGIHSCTRTKTNPVLLESVQPDLPAIPLKPATAYNSEANAQRGNRSSRLAPKQRSPRGKAGRFLVR